MFNLFIDFVLVCFVCFFLVVVLRDYDEFYVELHNAALIKSLKSHLCMYIYILCKHLSNYYLYLRLCAMKHN